jgi:hypothetical protein
MKIVKSKIVTVAILGTMLIGSQAFAASSSPADILKQGLLGAGTGAIASGVSGGNAGKGALIGAGTNVIGGALLGFLTDSSGSSQQLVYYAQQPVYYSAPQPQPVYQPEPVYVQQPAAYATYSQPQVDSNKQILKQGILGAGTGAIAASASGGNAGKGALIGAGTNVIGGALLDTLTGTSTAQSAPVYYATQPVYSNYNPGNFSRPAAYDNTQPKKHIIRKFDSNGNIISEEEISQ